MGQETVGDGVGVGDGGGAVVPPELLPPDDAPVEDPLPMEAGVDDDLAVGDFGFVAALVDGFVSDLFAAWPDVEGCLPFSDVV